MLNKANVSEKENVNYWNDFYNKVTLDDESTFCSFIKNIIDQDVTIIDIGCGSGRDTYSFAKEGYKIYGIDRSIEAIKKNNEKVKSISNIEFQNIDIGEENELHDFICRVMSDEKKLLIYSRFFLHSINKETEEFFLNILSKVLRQGDVLALEFRTIEDENIDKVYNNHYRRYINAKELKVSLEQDFSFTTDYFHKGQGLSKFKDEDPYLGRMILTKL